MLVGFQQTTVGNGTLPYGTVQYICAVKDSHTLVSDNLGKVDSRDSYELGKPKSTIR